MPRVDVDKLSSFGWGDGKKGRALFNNPWFGFFLLWVLWTFLVLENQGEFEGLAMGVKFAEVRFMGVYICM